MVAQSSDLFESTAAQALSFTLVVPNGFRQTMAYETVSLMPQIIWYLSYHTMISIGKNVLMVVQDSSFRR